jgi:hypothetical protein
VDQIAIISGTHMPWPGYTLAIGFKPWTIRRERASRQEMNLPKLNKDQIQKLALSLMGVVFLLYVYFSFFLGPLANSRANTLVQIRDMQSKLDGSKDEIQKAAKLELTAKKAAARFESMKTFYPEGAPIAWFPPRIKTFSRAEDRQDECEARKHGWF